MSLNSDLVKLILNVDENFLGIGNDIFFQDKQENGLCKSYIFSLVYPTHKKKDFLALVVISSFQS